MSGIERRDFIKAVAAASATTQITSSDTIETMEIEAPKIRVNPMTGEVYVPDGADTEIVEITQEP